MVADSCAPGWHPDIAGWEWLTALSGDKKGDTDATPEGHPGDGAEGERGGPKFGVGNPDRVPLLHPALFVPPRRVDAATGGMGGLGTLGTSPWGQQGHHLGDITVGMLGTL